jgi:hypothetical protein
MNYIFYLRKKSSLISVPLKYHSMHSFTCVSILNYFAWLVWCEFLRVEQRKINFGRRRQKSLILPIVGEEVSTPSILLDKIWCWCFRIHVEDRWTVKGVNLIFESIEKKDRGNYTCQATVDGKEHTQSFKLVVISELKCFPSLYVLIHI